MKRLIDLTETRFGFWFVLKPAGKNKHNKTQWLCRCDCGTEKTITTNSLRSGNSTSCGCNHCPDLSNEKFDNITVIRRYNSSKYNRRAWECKCDCGKTLILTTYQIRNDRICNCNCKSIPSEFIESNIESQTNIDELRCKIVTIKNNCEKLVQETEQIIESLQP